MRRLDLLYFTLTALILEGCLVSTPVHQLPQGYSESYRQILRQRSSGTATESSGIRPYIDSGIVVPAPEFDDTEEIPEADMPPFVPELPESVAN